jgi:hypothetical protein
MPWSKQSIPTSVFGTAHASGSTLDFQGLGIQPIQLDEQGDISTEELWADIKAMPSDRAPGPDGFTRIFFIRLPGR